MSDPRDRPPDPAGTRPKVDPESLLPAVRTGGPVPIDADAVDEEPPGSELVPAGGAAPPGAAIPRETEHSPRFQFLWGALAAVAAIAIAATVLVATGGSSRPAADTWSPWHPRESADPLAQIAQHVAPEYRLSDGRELVAVTGGPLEIAGLPMQIALRQRPAEGGDIELLDGQGVLYRLCGLGKRCAIDHGKPSTQRHLLLRRESLELALFTFRYVSDIDQVVVFLPPPPGEQASQALLFRRGDVNAELARPLRATLSRRTPSVAGVDASPDAALVNRITIRTLYTFSLTQANQDASVFLVLEPFEPRASSK